MNWLNILYMIISIVATLVTVGVPFIITTRKTLKERKSAREAAEIARTEAEKAEAEAALERANADLLNNAKNFIAAAEVAFDGFDKMMKAQGKSAGPMKKDNVFTKLQAYALQNKYPFDADEWSAKIDQLVEFTKNVNNTKR
jgi:flagellar basal body-associated protein FliL